MASRLGPIEVLAVSFPGTGFAPRVLEELRSLVDRAVVTVVDGLLVRKDADGAVSLLELDQADLEEDLAPVAELVGEITADLLSDDDAYALTSTVAPGSSAVLLVLEHEWAKPLRETIAQTGGVLVADVRVPDLVVEDLLDTLDPGRRQDA